MPEDFGPVSVTEQSDPIAPTGGEQDRTFSQADVDRIVGDRLAKQARKFVDYDDLAKKAAQFDELESANRTDLEKAQARADKAEAAAASAVSNAKAQLIRAAVLVEAALAGAVDPDAVWALLPNDAVTIDDAGDVQGAAAAVKALLEDKTYLAPSTTPSTPPAVPTPGRLGGGPRPTSNLSGLEAGRERARKRYPQLKES